MIVLNSHAHMGFMAIQIAVNGKLQEMPLPY